MVKADTLLGAAIGMGSVASTVASIATGMPTGALGAQYAESTRNMTACAGIFGILSILILGGVGMAIVHKHGEDKYRHNQRVLRARRKRTRFRQQQINYCDPTGQACVYYLPEVEGCHYY